MTITLTRPHIKQPVFSGETPSKTTEKPISFRPKPVQKTANYLLLGAALLGGGTWLTTDKMDAFTRENTIQTVHYAIHPQEDNPPAAPDKTEAMQKWLKQEMAKSGLTPKELESTLDDLSGGIKKALGDWHLGRLSTNMLRKQLTMDEAFTTAREIVQKYSANDSTRKIMTNRLDKIKASYERTHQVEKGAYYTSSATAFAGIVLTILAMAMASVNGRDKQSTSN